MTASQTPQPPIDVDAVVAPIPGDNPAGANLDYSEDKDRIKAAMNAVAARVREKEDQLREQARGMTTVLQSGRRVDKELTDDERKKVMQMTGPAATTSLRVDGLTREWGEVRKLTAEALTKKSKDLQIAVTLLEALTCGARSGTESFAGTKAGLTILRRLVTEYWDRLYPPLDRESREPDAERVAALDWLNERLPIILTTIPLTVQGKYTLQHIEASQARGEQQAARRADGWPSSKSVQDALKALTDEGRDQLAMLTHECGTEAEALSAACDKKFGPQKVSFSKLTTLLDQCVRAVARPEWKRPGTETTTTDEGEKETDPEEPHTRDDNSRPEGKGLDALRAVQERFVSAPSERERFLRQLQMAEQCIDASMESLAYPLFDELALIINQRKLEEWEDPSLLAQVWSGLQRSAAAVPNKIGAKDRGQEAIEKLKKLRAEVSPESEPDSEESSGDQG